MREWISVKDRLPAEEGMYLLYITGRNYKTTKTDCYVIDKKNTSYRYWSLSSHLNVTHWMSLPEPPKEDK